MKGILFIFIFLTSTLSSQEIAIFYGRLSHSLNTISPIVFQIDFNKKVTYGAFQISYPLLNKKINITAEYSWFVGWTEIRAITDQDKYFGTGHARIKLRRYGISIDYSQKIIDDRLYLLPFIKISLETRLLQQDGRQVVTIIDGANNLNTYKGPVEIETFPGSQVLPNIGFKLKLRLFSKLYVIGNIEWSFGQETFQQMFFDYTYLDEPQPIGHWQTNGSGFIKSIGISYDFGFAK